MRKKFLLMLTLLILALGGGGNLFAQNVAKVGNIEYATIDEAIAKWTNNSTLTLLADVTLSDVVKLKSTEHHILNLGTYTMTAASGKHAIEITCEGRTSASYAITVNADATNPGGITATGKSCIYYKKSGSTKDRPIILINNGVFNGSYSINSISNGNTNCPQVWITGGIFNAYINLTKNLLQVNGGEFNCSINCTGDQNAYREIKGGRFQKWQFMTADNELKFAVGTVARAQTDGSIKPAVYNVGVYVDKEGYLVVGGPVITDLSAKYPAKASDYSKWSSYLKYSSAATYGLFYEDVDMAKAKHGEDNVEVYVPAVQINGEGYETLAEAIAEVEEGETIQINGTIEEQNFKLPSTLKNVTIKAYSNNTRSVEVESGAVLKNMTITSADGNFVHYEGLTFDGIIFDNSNVVLTGWRTGEVVYKDITVTNCIFKNIFRGSNEAAFHINCDVDEAVEGFTFTNNVIDGVSGTSNSGVYAQLTGNVTFTGNVINNVAFRPYVIQITTNDDIYDTFTVTGNTFSGSAVGRAQGLGSDAEGTDNVNIVVSNNIFKGITDAQQICYWNFNAAKTTADLSGNYYDIDILAKPGKIYYNSAAANTGDLAAMNVFPIYTALNEDGTIDETSAYTPVALAKIDDKNYYSLQAAIDAVQNNETITLIADITENVTLTEKTGLYYIIDGANKNLNGTITVNSLSDTNDNRRITVKNIEFVDSADANVDFISSVNTNHYPRLTIEGCTFTGSGNDGDVAVRLKSSHSVVIKDCTGTGLHSFLQNTSGWNLTIEKVTVTDSKSGLALGTVQGVTVKDCNITADGYGIRMDAQYNNNAVIESNKVNAFIPVVVRKAEVNSNMTFQGTNTFAASNTDGLWCAIGTSEYEANGQMPTAATGKVRVALNDTGLSMDGVYGAYVPVAKIGETEYTTLEAAFKAATEGCTIDIINNVTVDYAWDARYTGAKFTVPVTINGNGKTIKFAASVNDNNYQAPFRFEADATVKYLTIDMSETTDSRFRAISSKGNLTVDGCTFIGKDATLNCRAIIFGEGAGANVGNLAISITDSKFINWKRGITDNENAQDVKTVTITGNNLENSAVYVSAKETVTFTGNTVEGAYVDIRSYSADNALNVTATGNTLEENTDNAYNYIKARGTITAQEGFVIAPKGDKPIAYVQNGSNGKVRVWGETWGNAKESYALKLYSDDTHIATTTLNNINGIIDGDVNVTWSFSYPGGETGGYWTTIWHQQPRANQVPNKVVLVIDGIDVNDGPVYMSGPDGINPVKWEELGGVMTGGTWGGIDWTLVDGTLTIAPTTGTPVADPNCGKTYEVGAWREAVRYNSKGEGKAIEGWPYDRSKVKTLVIEEGVISIGSFTAQGYTNLTGEVVIPSTVKYIGQEAFQKSTMTKLTFAPVPAGETGEELCIAQGAFKNLIIEEVSLPADRPVHLHAWVFNNCLNLKTAHIPASVVSVHGTNHIDYFKDFNAHSDPTWTKSSEIFAYNKNMETVTFGSEEVRDLFYSYDNNTSDKDYIVATVGLTSYCKIADAIAAVNMNGGTIKLHGNATLDDTWTIPAGKEVTLNLNGKTIGQYKDCTASYSMINNKGNLTIKGEGKLSFKDTGAGDPNFGWGSYTVRNEGNLVVENATIEHKGAQEFAKHMICAIFQYSGSTTINGGTISTPNYRSARLWKGDMTINGGTFDGQLWVQAVDNSAKLTINGGTFEPNGQDASAVFVTNADHDAKLAVTNGTFKGKVGCSDATKLAGTITGGMFTETAKNGTNSTLLATGLTFGEADANGYYTVQDDPTTHYINNVEELKAFRDEVNSGNTYAGVTVYLAADIDLEEEDWTPITKFNGTFDGQDYTISNLWVTGSGNCGFFKQVADQTEHVTGTVKNVNFENATIISQSGNGTAGIIADARLGARINNVNLTGEVTIQGYRGVGGIVGAGFPVIEGCTVEAEGSITATYWGAGGILGFASDKGAKAINSTVKGIGEGLTIHGEYGGVGSVTGTPYGAAVDGATINDVNITSNNDYYMAYVDASGEVKNANVDNVVVKVNGNVIVGCDAVATIGTKPYFTFADAVAAAENNATINLIWKEGKAPIAMNASLYGKSVTITGTATVDWSKGFLFVGRGGEGNATLTFDGANLTSASNSASYGIHVSGREKNTSDKYNGTVVIKNSTIDLDYLINKGEMTLDNATLTVKNGFSIGGRPASETESGADATATITLNNGSKVVVNNHNGMGLGYEAIGVMNINGGSTFKCTQDFLVTAKGTMNVNGGVVTIAEDKELNNNGAVVVTGNSQLDVKNYSGNAIQLNNGNLVDTYFAGRIDAFGVNNISGTTEIVGILGLGYETNPTEQVVVNITGNFKGTNVLVSTNNGVDNILNVGKADGERTKVHFGQLGAFADVNVVNADVTYGYAFIRNDFNALNSAFEIKGGVNTYFSGNANVVLDNTTWNLSGYANIGSYGGYMYGNADVTLKNGSSMTATSLGIEVSGEKVVKLTLEDNSSLTAKNLKNQGAIELDATSELKATAISGAGTITIDAADFVIGGGDVQVVTANMNGFTGTINVVNNNYVTAERTETGIVIKENELEGEGTETNPYIVSSLTELELFRNKVNAGDNYAGEYVKLTANVDLSATRSANNWEPIGTTACPFKGTFDGDNKVISNLVVEGESYVGLFGYADNANIKNVTINNANVKGVECVGVIAGNVYSTSLIDNCHVKGNIKVEGQTSVGGIVGKYYTKVSNCSVIGDGVATSYVKGTYVESDFEGDNIGGIMGHGGENNRFTGNTVKNITISGTRKVGGVVGVTDKATQVVNCVVENVNIETTAEAEYAESNKAKSGHGAIVGSYTTGGTAGLVADCVVKNVNFINENDVTFSAGPITGGARGDSDGMSNPTGVTASNNDIYMSTIKYSNNSYLMNAVAEIGGVKYYSLQEAINKVGDGETITLLSDVNVTTPAYGQNALNYSRAINSTIDLNGKILSANTGNSVFRFNITDSGATSDVTVKMMNGTVVAGADTWCAVMAAGISADVKAIFNLEDITINGSKAGDLAVKSWDNAVVNANNVTIETTNGAGGFYAVGGEIVLNNCTVNQKGLHTAPYLSMAFAVSTEGKMTINSGTYSSEPTAAYEGYNQGTSHGSWVGGVMNSGGTLIINGGTFSNDNYGDNSLATAARGLIFADTKGIVEVNGGTFNALKSIFDFQNNLVGGTSPVITVKGGEYNANPKVVTSYGAIVIPEGYVVVENTTNGTWVVKQVYGTQTREFTKGWNWFSSYVNLSTNDPTNNGLEKLETALGTSGIQIKGQTNNQSATYEYLGKDENGNELYAWIGSFTPSMGKMYMVKTSAPVTGQITGDFVPENTAIALNKGWNWISYPLNVEVEINEALKHLEPEEGDVIKMYGSGFAEYFMDQWWPTPGIETLKPGLGYMYKSAKSTSFVYSADEVVTTTSRSDDKAIDYRWTPEASEYAFNMSVIATLNVDGEMMSDGYEIAAFANGECRGSARPIYIEKLGQYMLFLTIYGDEVEELTFKCYDVNYGTEYELSNRFNYSSDAVLGSMAEPYMFNMNFLNIEESTLDMINIYPNPTTTDRAINLQATCDNVEVFNALGVKVAEYQNVDTIDALETAGIYVIRVTINGETRNCRLVVK